MLFLIASAKGRLGLCHSASDCERVTPARTPWMQDLWQGTLILRIFASPARERGHPLPHLNRRRLLKTFRIPLSIAYGLHQNSLP